tara:strand:+ start:17 stop:571 length:555 start_codon:yes stop_codon:yes gene_type:complete
MRRFKNRLIYIFGMKEKIFYVDNLKKDLKNIKKELINDCISSFNKRSSWQRYYMGSNYELFTKYHDKLYSLYLDNCKKNLKKFTVTNTETKLWGYYTNKDYSGTQLWHNHEDTCNLCGVLYLKTVKDCGIKLKHKNKVFYIEPKPFDLLVFPGFVNHKPVVSKDKERISIQFEISCIENDNKIW